PCGARPARSRARRGGDGRRSGGRRHRGRPRPRDARDPPRPRQHSPRVRAEDQRTRRATSPAWSTGVGCTQMPAWLVWALLAVALTVGEILTPGLFFLGPVALAALASMLAAALGGGIWIQIAVFALGSVASVGVLRPIARAHLRMPRAIRTGTDALEG